MASRYNNTRPFANSEEIYDEFFADRDLNYIYQYRTGRLTQPTVTQRASLQGITHIWTLGDRLSKLAYQYYGDTRLWWVIAWYNGRPTEAHFDIGSRIIIPAPLDRVLSMLKRT
jgi:nucleoid-associated protein YgaU